MLIFKIIPLQLQLISSEFRQIRLVITPTLNRFRIDKLTYLPSTGCLHCPFAFVKIEARWVPRRADKIDQSTRLRSYISDRVFVAQLKYLQRQILAPVRHQSFVLLTIKCKIIKIGGIALIGIEVFHPNRQRVVARIADAMDDTYIRKSAKNECGLIVRIKPIRTANYETRNHQNV